MIARLATLLISLSAVVTLAAAPQQSNWRRLDSPNFIVIGEVNGSDLRDIAVKFEAFREVLGRLLNQNVTSSAVPTVVIVFRGDATFKPFMPVYQGKRVEVAGLFVPRRDVNHIAMVSDGNLDRLRVIFHEYAHLLVSNTGQQVPVWLNEGIAEYYSTFELQRGGRDAVIGRVIENHIQLLNQMPLLKLPELLAVDHRSPLYNEGNRRSVFYAQSWALTHMILRSDKNRTQQLANYIAALANGQEPAAAWQAAFGGDDLGRELDTYIRRQAFTATLYKFTDRLATFESQAVPISQADLDAYLGDLLVQEDSLDDAAERLASAEKRDPGNARTKVAKAALASAKGDLDVAEQLARSVGDADDWFLNYRAGVEFVGALERKRSSVTPADIETARRYFGRAAGPGKHEFANALARMAGLEVAAPGVPGPEVRASLERAHAIAPGRHEYGLLLAHALARQSDFAAARAILGPLMSTLNPPQIRDAARSLMGSIVTIEAARAKGSAPPSLSAAATTSSLTVETSEPAVRPVYRELKTGEQRIEGALEQIECVAGKGVTFRVKTANGSVSVTSPDLTSVDFITYRNDLKGSVSCGPISPVLPVYVTWRAGTAAGSKVAVAIEFLPK